MMMKWLKQKFRNWVLEDDRDGPQLAISKARIGINRSPDVQGINFSVYPAQGGRIIEVRTYDDRKDLHHNKLYIVRDDQDLGKEIDHIITLECLRQ